MVSLIWSPFKKKKTDHNLAQMQCGGSGATPLVVCIACASSSSSWRLFRKLRMDLVPWLMTSLASCSSSWSLPGTTCERDDNSSVGDLSAFSTGMLFTHTLRIRRFLKCQSDVGSRSSWLPSSSRTTSSFNSHICFSAFLLKRVNTISPP